MFQLTSTSILFYRLNVISATADDPSTYPAVTDFSKSLERDKPVTSLCQAAVTFPSTGNHRPYTSTKLHCLTKAHRCQ